MRRLLLFVSLAAGLACPGSAPPGEYFRFQKQGEICAFPEGTDPGNAFLPSTTVTFQANQTASIRVMAPTCLSSSCSKDARADCAVQLDGNVLAVTSTATFRREGETCTDDCGALVARCTTPVLPAG